MIRGLHVKQAHEHQVNLCSDNMFQVHKELMHIGITSVCDPLNISSRITSYSDDMNILKELRQFSENIYETITP
jgi:hypothetical protein